MKACTEARTRYLTRLQSKLERVRVRVPAQQSKNNDARAFSEQVDDEAA